MLLPCDPKVLSLSAAQSPLRCGIWTREFPSSAKPETCCSHPSPVVPPEQLYSQGTSGNVKSFLLSQLGARVLLAPEWAEARDAANCPTGHRAAFTQQRDIWPQMPIEIENRCPSPLPKPGVHPPATNSQRRQTPEEELVCPSRVGCVLALRGTRTEEDSAGEGWGGRLGG